MTNHRGIARTVGKTAVLLALLASVAPAQAGNPGDFDQDPALEENWMLDRERQLILDKPTYLNNLREQRLCLEAEVKKDPKLAQEDTIRAAHKLVPIYQALGLNKELTELTKRLEDHSFVASQWLLQSFYLARSDKQNLLQVLKRSYALQKAATTVDRKCADLIQLADLHYQLGEMAAAESYYKKAADLALKDVALQNPPPRTYIFVPIGAINSYACFLAEKDRMKEADSYMSKAAIFALQRNKYDLSTGYGGFDDLGTFLEIIKKKDPKLYYKYYLKWLAITRDTPYAGILGKNGQELTAPIFRNISAFNDGLAAAQERFTCRYGYIDKTGNWKLKPTFLAANPFCEGVATAKISRDLLPIDVAGKSTSFSLIDSSGKELKKLIDLDVTAFNGNLCMGYRRNRRMIIYANADLIDISGETLLSGRISEPIDRQGNQFKLFIPTGTTRHGCIVEQVGYIVTVSVKADATRPGHFRLTQENLEHLVDAQQLPEKTYSQFEQMKVKQTPAGDTCKIDEQTGGSFLVDLVGNYLSKKYIRIERLNSKCFRVQDDKYEFGLIDAQGHEKVPPKYNEIRAFSEGLAAFQINNRWGFVNENGREIVPAKYIEVGDYKNDFTFYKRLQ